MPQSLTLRDLVQSARDSRGVSVRQLAFQAEKAGYKVTYTTLHYISAGTYKSRPSASTLRAIAWLADVPEAMAFTAAGLPVPGPPLADELPPGSDDLSPRSRRTVIEVVRTLVALEQQSASAGVGVSVSAIDDEQAGDGHDDFDDTPQGLALRAEAALNARSAKDPHRRAV